MSTTAFACPRCRTDVDEEFYGPCAACRTQLRATLGGEGHELDEAATRFEPAMHVTPNAVALTSD